MTENHISSRILPSIASLATAQAVNRSAQNNRIVALANPNAALLDMQEEVAFAFGEKMEKKSAEKEKVEERNAKRLKELERLVKSKGGGDDKSQEQLQKKLENYFKAQLQQQQRQGQLAGGAKFSGAAGNETPSTPSSKNESWQESWRNSMAATTDKAAIFQALGQLGEKSEQKGDSQAAKIYQDAQARCAQEFEPQIRAAVNVRNEYQDFAKKNNLPAEKVLDAYQKTVADYSGILSAALTLTEKLGLKNSAIAATFIRETASKEITMLKPSVSPEKLLHLLAELKGLQVLATLKEQVSQHREAMELSERQLENEKSGEKYGEAGGLQTTSQASSQASSAVPIRPNYDKINPDIATGIASLSNENLVTALLQSAVKPQDFPPRIDVPAQKAYAGKIKELVLHMQGLHKIFKSIPEYAFADRLGKQKALMPVENRIDSLIAREREAMETKVASLRGD